MSAGSVAVVLQNASGESALPSGEQFSRWVTTALEDKVSGEVAVRVVNRAESRALNHTYRGQNRPTNVLAFPAGPLEVALPVEESAVGDLVICAPVVRDQARSKGISEEAHWAHMVVHGCLHLLGWDHQTDDQARAMQAREGELLISLGYADPYR